MRTKRLDFNKLPEERQATLQHGADLLFNAAQKDCTIGILLSEIREDMRELGWRSSKNFLERYPIGGNLFDVQMQAFHLNRHVRRLIRLSADEPRMSLYLIDFNASKLLKELSELRIKRSEMKLVVRMVVKRMEHLGQFNSGWVGLPRVGHTMEYCGYLRYYDSEGKEHESEGLECTMCQNGDTEIKPELLHTRYSSVDVDNYDRLEMFRRSVLRKHATA